jgi:hypothetical protein
MTQTHRFTEPAPVMDLVLLRRVPIERDPLIQFDPEYELWIEETYTEDEE